MEKWVLDRRIGLMSAAGVQFHTSVAIGSGGTPLSELQRTFDAVILAVGSTRPRMVPAPGSDLVGVFPAMTYLEASNRAVTASTVSEISAEGLHVVILGGGDTGADCLGTAHRQGAATVTQIEILDTPPETRPFDQPWPTMPRLFKVTTAHEEGGERLFSTETLAFEGDGYVTAISLRDRHTGAEWSASADLVLVAAGFLGPELDRLGLDAPQYVTPRESLSVGFDWRLEELPGDTPVFACGDAVRGQSLIVWAIAEGRSCASAVDTYLGGGSLPAPVAPYQTSW
jgi:glutamate synthase (NADPH/NADH) small chain